MFQIAVLWNFCRVCSNRCNIQNRKFVMLNGIKNYNKFVVFSTGKNNVKNDASKEKSKDLKLCKSSETCENLSKVCEGLLNQQISVELEAAFAYFSMACYFGRSEIALAGCQGYFLNMHQEEHEHAMMFTNYILKRGGIVSLKNINVPTIVDWKSICNALQEAMKLERKVKDKFDVLYCAAGKQGDFDLEDFIAHCISHQNQSICEIARLLTRAQMADNKTGEYLFDKMLFNSFVAKRKNNLMYIENLGEWKDEDVYK